MPETILMMAFCGLVVVASLGAIFWAIWSGAFRNMDGLLAITVSLAAALIFGGNILSIVRRYRKAAHPNPSSAGSSPESKTSSAREGVGASKPAKPPAPVAPG